MIIPQKISNIFALLLGAVFVGIGVIACGPPERPGTTDQAIATRAGILQGQEILSTVRSEMDALLGKLTTVQIAKDLLMGPKDGGKMVVSKAEILTSYGVYDEISNGGFNPIPDSTKTTITIQFTNGVDLVFSNFTFTEDTVEVSGFDWTATSNMRGLVTPDAESIEINATASRLVVPSQYKLFVNLIQPSINLLGGNITYMRGAETVSYYIERKDAQVTASLTGSTLVELAQSSMFEVYNVLGTGGIPTGAPYWKEGDTISYIPANVASKWVAALRDYQYVDSFGRELGTTITITKDTNTNFAVFEGMGTANLDVSGVAAAFRFGDDEDSDGRRRNHVWVAQVVGGPYTCDLRDNTGSGSNIVLDWLDPAQDVLMPTATVDCASSVITQAIK